MEDWLNFPLVWFGWLQASDSHGHRHRRRTCGWRHNAFRRNRSAGYDLKLCNFLEDVTSHSAVQRNRNGFDGDDSKRRPCEHFKRWYDSGGNDICYVAVGEQSECECQLSAPFQLKRLLNVKVKTKLAVRQNLASPLFVSGSNEPWKN